MEGEPGPSGDGERRAGTSSDQEGPSAQEDEEPIQGFLPVDTPVGCAVVVVQPDKLIAIGVQPDRLPKRHALGDSAARARAARQREVEVLGGSGCTHRALAAHCTAPAASCSLSQKTCVSCRLWSTSGLMWCPGAEWWCCWLAPSSCSSQPCCCTRCAKPVGGEPVWVHSSFRPTRLTLSPVLYL